MKTKKDSIRIIWQIKCFKILKKFWQLKIKSLEKLHIAKYRLNKMNNLINIKESVIVN